MTPWHCDVTLCRRRETGWELCYSSLTERQRPTLLASCLEEHNASGSVTVIWAVFKRFSLLDFTKLPAGFCLCWDSSVPLRHTHSATWTRTHWCVSQYSSVSLSPSVVEQHMLCVFGWWKLWAGSERWSSEITATHPLLLLTWWQLSLLICVRRLMRIRCRRTWL